MIKFENVLGISKAFMNTYAEHLKAVPAPFQRSHIAYRLAPQDWLDMLSLKYVQLGMFSNLTVHEDTGRLYLWIFVPDFLDGFTYLEFPAPQQPGEDGTYPHGPYALVHADNQANDPATLPVPITLPGNKLFPNPRISFQHQHARRLSGLHIG